MFLDIYGLVIAVSGYPRRVQCLIMMILGELFAILRRELSMISLYYLLSQLRVDLGCSDTQVQLHRVLGEYSETSYIASHVSWHHLS